MVGYGGPLRTTTMFAAETIRCFSCDRDVRGGNEKTLFLRLGEQRDTVEVGTTHDSSDCSNFLCK
ncbi:Ohr family peroxiredoxin [Sesbania bispinosa]|nr:Ohr family peroxiredoxin [Sesbania bispinosa]